MKWFAAAIPFALAACTSAAEKAEKDYTFLESNHAPADELCAQADKAMQAWAAKHNESKFRNWRVQRYLACSKAGQSVSY